MNKLWCMRCKKPTTWYSRPSVLAFCPFNPIWACEECDRENVSPGDEDLRKKRKRKTARR